MSGGGIVHRGVLPRPPAGCRRHGVGRMTLSDLPLVVNSRSNPSNLSNSLKRRTNNIMTMRTGRRIRGVWALGRRLRADSAWGPRARLPNAAGKLF